MASPNNVYDVIIVGGGTAGLVVASRLSEDPKLQTLVLEAGQDQTQDPRVITPALGATLHKTPSDWDYTTTPQAGMRGREIQFPQGKMLGGSSGLNGLSFTASAKAVVDGWAKLGNTGWDWPSFSTSLEKTYTVAKAPPSVTKRSDSSSSSNGGGLLKLAYAEDYTGGWPKIWADTIESLGLPGAQDTLTSQANGGLMIPDTVDPSTAMRSYAASAYLAPVRDRVNLTVATGVEVRKLLFDKPAGDADVFCTGVEYTDATGAVQTTTAQKEVIISAGAIGSPKILELSGLGDAQRLTKEVGVDVVVDLPGVGENLQNHPMASLSFEVVDTAPPTKDAFVRQDPAVLGAAMEEYATKQSGVFASSGVASAVQLPLPGFDLDTPEGQKQLESLLDGIKSAGNPVDGPFATDHEAFVRSILSSPSEASGYHIFGPAYAGYNPDGTSAQPPADNPDDRYITIVALLPHPLSRGSVHVVGMASESGNDHKLAIDPGYLSHPLDLEVMARHIQFIDQELVAVEPLAKLLKPNGKRGLGVSDPRAFKDLDVAKDFLRNHCVGAHHYTGTCSVLPREKGGVVDPQLRVYGTKNLRVCDASVVPLMSRANPQATVYGVAEHGASLIKAVLSN